MNGVREVRKGVWQLRWYGDIDPATGKRRRQAINVEATGVRDAERKRAEAMVASQGAAGSHNFADACADFIDRARARRTPGHIFNQERILAKHIRPGLGGISVEDLKVRHLDDFYDALQRDNGLSGATIRKVHALISTTLRRAVRDEWVQTNVAEVVELPPINSKRVKVPEMADVLAVQAVAHTIRPWLPLYLQLAVITGARRGEIAALAWDDVNWIKSNVSITKAIHEATGSPLLVKGTKTGDERIVSLDPATLRMLEKHHSDQLGQGVRCGDHDFIFTEHEAGIVPFRPSRATKAFADACKAAEVEGMRLHDLRHASASLLMAAGVPPTEIAQRLGHKRVSTTLDFYSHAMREDTGLGDLLGQMLSSGKLIEPSERP